MDYSHITILNAVARNTVIACAILILLLLIYFVLALVFDVKRRKEKEEEIEDIIASADMGIWRIELVENKAPRMYVDDTMKKLLGIEGQERTPEKTYEDWFFNVTPDAVPSVLKSVEKMKQGFFDENTYLWIHPTKGIRYVRCGGTSQKIPGGCVLRGYHYDVDELVRTEQAQVITLKEALEEKREYYSTLGSLADVFYSMHVIDLEEDTVFEYGSKDEVREYVNRRNGAREMMAEVMSALTTEEFREAALEFTDLSTVADRMQNKKMISKQLIGVNTGWFNAGFIACEVQEDGRPKKVIFTTRVIDDQKKQEEQLIVTSHTDELTKALNRRAYEEALQEIESKGMADDFGYFSIDINGLKLVNDNIGHEAGDELIVGAYTCINDAVGNAGRVYRTGGDEFIALVYTGKRSIQEIEERLEENISRWKGNLVDSLALSYGYVTRASNLELSLHEIAVLADRRMYDSKARYYKTKGIDRRGRKAAHTELLALYTKILKINVSEDSYQVIDLNQQETMSGYDSYTTISQWFMEFGKQGNVHPDSLEEYNKKTDIDYIRKHFAETNEPLRITYKRKFGDQFKEAIMEIIKANDYSDDNQNLFLYVKDIEE